MISVSRLIDSDPLAVEIPGLTFTVLDPTVPIGHRTISCGGLIVARTGSTGPQLEHLGGLDLSYMIQGPHAEYGLRDTNVSHFQSSGEIVLAGFQDSALPVSYNPPYGAYTINGRWYALYVDGRLVPTPAAHVVPFGCASESREELPIPAYFDMWGELLPASVVVWSKVVFTGDGYGYLLIKRYPYHHQYATEDPLLGSVRVEGSEAIRFFHIDEICDAGVGYSYSPLLDPATLSIGDFSTGGVAQDRDTHAIPGWYADQDVQMGTSISVFGSDTRGTYAQYDALKDSFESKQFKEFIFDVVVPDFQYDYGELGAQVVDQVRTFDIDLLSSILELKTARADWLDLRTLGNSICQTIETIPSHIRNSTGKRLLGKLLSHASELNLSYSFGISPTVSDIKSIHDGLVANAGLFIPQRLHSRERTNDGGVADSPVARTMVCTAAVDRLPPSIYEAYLDWYSYVTGLSTKRPTTERRDFLQTIQANIGALKRRRLYPSFESVWNNLPLSFVLDYFLKIGKLAESLDYTIDLQYYPVREVLLSRKSVFTPSPARLWPEIGCTGSVCFSHYERYVSSDLPHPPYEVERANGVVRGNLANALSLICVWSSPK